MFSVIFPGQGSQIVGMAKDLHSKFEIVNKGRIIFENKKMSTIQP